MTTTYTVSSGDIINAAFRVMGVYDDANPPTAQDTANGLQALNLLAKAWSIKGLKLWIVNQINIPLVAGKVSYTLGPTGDIVTDRPYRVIVGHCSQNYGGTVIDQPLIPLSRQEYDMLGYKLSTGKTTQFYYDPTISTGGMTTSNGVLFVYPVPDTSIASALTLQLWVHVPVQDMSATTAQIYFPSEWYETLKYGLAKTMVTEYAVPQEKAQTIVALAQESITELENWASNEEAGTFLTPDFRGFNGYGGRRR